MNTTYTYGMKKVIIENNKVIHSDTTLCEVGQKPNLAALKACGWKKEKNIKPSYIKGLKNGQTFYN
jgi:hypothetical protein